MISEVTSFKSPYQNILSDLQASEELPCYAFAVQTVRSIALLDRHQNQFTRENLTAEVKQLTGLNIHAAENYPDAERFRLAVKFAVKILEQTYAAAKCDNDKLRFFRYGLGLNLGDSACFEIRVETIYNYFEQSQTLLGLLQFEIKDLQRSVNSETPVELDELVKFLKNKNFFEEQNIDVSRFGEHPLISKLREQNLIASEKDLITCIDEAFSVYEDFGSGEEAFLSYLFKQREFADVSKKELLCHLEEYFALHPERKSYL